MPSKSLTVENCMEEVVACVVTVRSVSCCVEECMEDIVVVCLVAMASVSLTV